MRRLRAVRAEVIEPEMATNHGRLFHTAGDSILIEFASVVDAARCAVAVQRAMAARNVSHAPEKRIDFRIGIHLGDVMVEGDGDFLGDGVNIAARLEGIADRGGIRLSRRLRAGARQDRRRHSPISASSTLKNIARPVQVYAIELGHRRLARNRAAVDAAGRSPPPAHIVVLPFANIGGDPDQEYFADGVTESLTTDLRRIAGSFVIARNTAFTYKGKPIDVKADRARA